MQPFRLQSILRSFTKFSSVLSSLFVVSGLSIIGFGSWMLIEQQLELANPPARVVEVAELVAEPAALPLAASLAPKSALSAEKSKPALFAAEPARAKPLAAAPASWPHPVATLEPVEATAVAVAGELADTSDLGLMKQAAAAQAAPKINGGAAETEVSAEVMGVAPMLQPADESQVLTLADNPLAVVEEEVGQSAQGGGDAAARPAQVPASPEHEAASLTRIVAESIGLDTTVLEVGWQKIVQNGVETSVWIVADYAAGWHQNSALPGEGGNIVMSGHHNIKGEIFRYIVDLEPGAIISLYDANQQRHDYYVEDKFIVKDKGEPEVVRRENAKWIGQFNEERLTMITCWPYNNNTHRVIVISKPLPAQ